MAAILTWTVAILPTFRTAAVLSERSIKLPVKVFIMKQTNKMDKLQFKQIYQMFILKT